MHVKNWSIDFKRLNMVYLTSLIVFAVLFAPASTLSATTNTEKKPLTLQDMMKFKSIQNPEISEKGDWVVYNTKPDRGNGEAIAYSVNRGKIFTIPRGDKPVITKDSRWVAAVVQPDAQ
jgi:hypothetical protein